MVSNLNKSVDETQGGCFDPDYYEVATKEQYDAQEAAKAPKQEVESSKVDNNPEVMLEAAYLAGYEPSEAVTTSDEEIEEAMEYLTNQDVRS